MSADESSPDRTQVGPDLGQGATLSSLAERLRDVIVVTTTPFDADLHLDLTALKQHLRFLTHNGLKVLTVNGNTGEFYALTVDEAKSIVERAVDVAANETTVIAGVGHDLDTAVDLARHAESSRCDAVMVHHPANPFVGGTGFADYVAVIAGAVEIGIVPYVRSGHLDDSAVMSLVRIPNVVAIKYAVNDVLKISALIAATQDAADITWCCGTAEAWAPPFFTAGATGFTSGLANVTPKLALAMRDALASGDAALVRSVWTQVRPFEALRASQESAANVTVVKEAMHRLGLGPRYVRPPAGTLTDRAVEQLDEILRVWATHGFV